MSVSHPSPHSRTPPRSLTMRRRGYEAAGYKADELLSPELAVAENRVCPAFSDRPGLRGPPPGTGFTPRPSFQVLRRVWWRVRLCAVVAMACVLRLSCQCRSRQASAMRPGGPKPRNPCSSHIHLQPSFDPLAAAAADGPPQHRPERRRLHRRLLCLQRGPRAAHAGQVGGLPWALFGGGGRGRGRGTGKGLLILVRGMGRWVPLLPVSWIPH